MSKETTYQDFGGSGSFSINRTKVKTNYLVNNLNSSKNFKDNESHQTHHFNEIIDFNENPSPNLLGNNSSQFNYDDLKPSLI